MSMIPKFTFGDLVKHPVSVFLITLMTSTSVLYFALSRSYEARINAAETRERAMKADRDTLQKQYIMQLKDDARLGMENAYLKSKDSITKAKLIQPIINKQNGNQGN